MKKSSIGAWSWIRLQAHRSLAKGGWYQFAFYAFIVLLLLGILSVSFLLSATSAWAIQDYQTDSPFAAAFYHLFTNGGENKLGNLPAGWLVTIAGVIMVSILTSLFTNAFDKAALRFLQGETHYVVRNHVAVFGYHEMLPGLLKQMFDAGDSRYFLIQTTKVEAAREDLSRVLTKEQMRRVILQNGDLASAVDLAHMRVDQAGEIFILGNEMKLGADSAHDVAVLQCLKNIVGILPVPRDDSGKILCHVMFEHHSTFAVFQHTDLNKDVFEKLAFLPFNYYEMWARRVFINDSLTPRPSDSRPYLPLEGTSGIGKDSDDHVHLVVIGMSRMGIALGLQAAHLGHYPNFIRQPGRKTRITFIDRNARVEMYHLQGRMEAMFQTAEWRFVEPGQEDCGYASSSIDATPWHHPLSDTDSRSPYKSATQHLGKDFVDIQWEFIQADAENPVVQAYLGAVATDAHTRLTVAVCLPDTNQAIAAGINLPPVIYETAVQVLIYQRPGDSIVRTLSESAISGHASFSRIRPFGMSSDCYNLGLVNKLAYIACSISKDGARDLREMLVSDAYVQLQRASKSKSAAANMWSNIYNASHLWTKLRSVHSVDGSIPEDDIKMLAQTEHIRWNVEQLLTQYRPLLESEQADFLHGKTTKDALKREKLAHLDIASQARLEAIDPDAVPWDERTVQGIPLVYQKLQERGN